MRYLSVKNFERFQHYADRSPAWIKLYNRLLDDYEYIRLGEGARSQLIGLWLLASRHGNAVPYDDAYLREALHVRRLYVDELVASTFVTVLNERPEQQSLRADWASRYVSGDTRAAVLARDGACCVQCGARADLEIDHIVPISKGGTGELSNLQTLCRSCNRSKRARSAEQMRSNSRTDAEQEGTQTLRSSPEMRTPTRARTRARERRGEKRREEESAHEVREQPPGTASPKHNGHSSAVAPWQLEKDQARADEPLLAELKQLIAAESKGGGPPQLPGDLWARLSDTQRDVLKRHGGFTGVWNS